MRTRSPAFLVCLSLPLLALGPAACGGGDSTGPEEQIGSIEFDMLATVLRSEIGTAGSMLMLPNGPPGCVDLSAYEDTDGDGVPESSDFTYSASGCQFAVERGTGTTTGTVHVTDPGAAFGFQAVLEGLTYRYDLTSPTVLEMQVLNGQREVSGSATHAVLTQNVQLAFSLTDRPTAEVSESWQAVLTPAAGSQVAFGLGMRVPDGGVEVSGPFSITQNGTTAVLDLETVVPLRFPTTCGSPFASVGELHATVVSGGPSGYIKVVWSECGGEAEVDFIAD